MRPVVAPGLWMAAVARGQKTHFPHLASWLQVPLHLPMKTRAQRDEAAWKSPLGWDGTSAPNEFLFKRMALNPLSHEGTAAKKFIIIIL